MNVTPEQISEAYRIAKWLEGLKATTNDTFFPLYADTSRFLVLKGGAGSGKSQFAARKGVERCVHEPGHRWLVVRKVKDSLRDSCFDLILDTFAKYHPTLSIRPTQQPMHISLPNGSQIIFAGLNDIERLKSINEVSMMWIEEASELSEEDFSQLDLRLRGEPVGGYFQMMLSFNPISATHWLKRRFFDEDAPDRFDACIHNSTYKDNRFIDDKYKARLESYKDKDPYYYMVYCLNQWGVTGSTVFNAELVAKRLEENIQPLRTGDFVYDYDGLRISNAKFIENDDGAIAIYEEPKPGYPYVGGGDTAGDGSDKFVGQFIDNTNGKQVARLRHTYDEDLYAHQMYCLGMYYNEALIGIETNFSTHPVKELERLNYPRQYIREVPDNFDHSIRHSWGFNTNSKTRPDMIANLVKAFREDYTIVNDYETLCEMLTFIRNPKKNMRPEAEEGAHDDCVMALAIAHQIREQQDMHAPELIEPSRRIKWEEDMLEDYYNADDETKLKIEKEWGRPKYVN